MIDILTYNDIVKNVCVYGLDESVKASKYPMAVDPNKSTPDITLAIYSHTNEEEKRRQVNAVFGKMFK